MITKNAGSQSVVFKPMGNLDALKSDHYRQRLRPMLNEGFRFIIVDLEQTEYVSSSGLGLLVELYNHVSRHDGSLKLLKLPDSVKTLLKQTRLDKILLQGQPEPKQEGVALDQLHALMSREILFCSKINEVAERSLRSKDPKEIAEVTLEGIASVCGTPRGIFFGWEGDERSLVLLASFGMAGRKNPLPEKIVLSESAMELPALEENRIVRLDGFRNGSGSAVLSALSMVHAVALPVFGESRGLGMIVLEETGGEDEPVECFGPLLRTYCSICGLALEKTALLTQLQVQNSDLERTLTELQNFQNTLVDAGKLAALGAVISGIGHMMNNKLVPIIGYTQMLAQPNDLPEKTRNQLKTVNSAAVELKGVMEKLIKVSKAREISADQVDINELLSKTLRLLNPNIDRNRVSVRLSLADAVPPIVADKELLLQAFLAIIHRATMSFAKRSKERWIEIRTSVCDLHVEVRVEDNGEGLCGQPVDEWLDPLVPFMNLDEGQLFNFSIPRSVARRHQGELEVDEKPGGGTEVVMRLPLMNNNPRLASMTIEQRMREIA